MNERRFTAQEIREVLNTSWHDLDRETVHDMLRYAATLVERCDNVLKANASDLKYRHKDADVALAYANYILRGAAGKAR